MNIENNKTEKEFDFSTFDWDKWNRDMKKAIDGINEMTERMKYSPRTELSEGKQAKEGEINGGKVQWWKKCFTRTKRNS